MNRPTEKPPVILAIGGSDSSGGAGIAADVQAITAMKMRPSIAIAHITAQHDGKYYGALPVPAETLALQLRAVAEGCDIRAVKTGMLGTRETVETVADWLEALPELPPLVVDPVMLSSSGGTLLDEAGVDAMRRRLFPKAALITPNIPEAEHLTGQPVPTTEAMLPAARNLLQSGAKAVLLKGGHLPGNGEITDLLAMPEDEVYYASARMKCAPRGTGCRLASAIAACLGQGMALPQAVECSRAYLHTLFEFPCS